MKREFCFCFRARKNSCREQRYWKASFRKGRSQFVTRLQQTGRRFEAAEVPLSSSLLPIPKGCPVSVLPLGEDAGTPRRGPVSVFSKGFCTKYSFLLGQISSRSLALVFPALVTQQFLGQNPQINNTGFKLMKLLQSALQALLYKYEGKKLS